MPFLGELSALLTAVLWSGSAMIFASATTRMGSMLANITRLVIASIYLILFILGMRFSFHLTLSQYLNLSLSGIVGLALGDTFLFKAFQQIGARLAMLIMSVAPAITAVLAYILLGETISVWGSVGIVVTIAGVSMVVMERSERTTSRSRVTATGVLFGTLAAAGQGVGLIFAKMAFLGGELNGFVATMVRILASLILLVPFAMLTKRIGDPVKTFSRDRKALLLLAAGSVLGPFLGISFSLIAVAHTNVGVAATIMGTVPILMLPLVRFVQKEVLSWKAIMGAFIAVGGVAILFLR